VKIKFGFNLKNDQIWFMLTKIRTKLNKNNKY